MENRGHVLVPERGSSPGFAQKPLTSYLTIEIRVVDDLESDRTPQIGVESLVGDTHGTPAELPQASVFSPKNFVMLIALSFRHLL
jgi:hypothetical protein